MSRFCWVVEEGSYSDYRVVGVFSSAKNARKVAKAINKADRSDDATVAKWPVDPAVEELNAGLKRFVVLMLRDGTVEDCVEREVSSYNLATTYSIWERTKAPAYKGKGVPDALQADVWAEDTKHAVKIANEARARMVAEGTFK
jgi:hypothetical protein